MDAVNTNGLLYTTGGENSLSYGLAGGASSNKVTTGVLDWADSDERTALIIGFVNTNTNGYMFMDSTWGELGLRLINTASEPTFYQDGTSNTMGTTISNATFAHYCSTDSGTNAHQQNSLISGDAATFTPTKAAKTNLGFGIGAQHGGTGPFTGKVYELLIWIGTQPTDVQMEEYVTEKYGISWA